MKLLYFVLFAYRRKACPLPGFIGISQLGFPVLSVIVVVEPTSWLPQDAYLCAVGVEQLGCDV